MLSAHILVIPEPRFGVDGLAYGAEHLERGEVVLLSKVLAKLHERPDGRGRSVELGHRVLLDDLPEAVVRWVERGPLEYDGRRAVEQGAVRNVRVTRNPT